MSTIREHMNELLGIIERINAETAEMQRAHSAVEKKVSDVYHRIELLNLNAVELSKAAIELRDALRERRRLKDGMRYHQSVGAQLKNVAASIKDIDKNIVKDHERWRKETIAAIPDERHREKLDATAV